MLGSLILYLKGMRIMMFQLSGFYCKRNMTHFSHPNYEVMRHFSDPNYEVMMHFPDPNYQVRCTSQTRNTHFSDLIYQ